ncbi:hypothetical protein [Sphingomonas sp. Leaf357]|uniref:hypothetical protein n=1 Tax=Sphingomonas sp. Leaf357 TaxID=1736350 RepID=UPI000AF6B8E4|nr:hypothetical protein [Sphingomonas sp. Leaf357]
MSNDTDEGLVDRDYHLKRAGAAQAMAIASRDACARRAHQAMAAEHLTRAEAPRRPGLKLVRE